MYTDSHLCFIRDRIYPLSYESSLHSHDFYHFIYIESGSATLLVEDNETTLYEDTIRAGQLHYLARGTKHVFTEILEPLHAITILFSISNSNLEHGIMKLPCVINPDIQTAYLFKSMLAEDKQRDFYYKKIINNYLEQILYFLLRSFNVINSEAVLTDESSQIIQRFFSEVDAEISPILQYIYKYIDHNFTIPELANACGFSVNALRVLFKTKMDITPKAAYEQVKYFHALDLLNNGSYNISEISEMLGFSSVHYFSRFFKKNSGLSPSYYQSENVTFKTNIII